MGAEPQSSFRSSTGNLHACAIELDGYGVLVRGASGSGKTSLCHGLIDHYHAINKDAVWISDDQVLLAVADDQLIARPPTSIAGKAELFGYGIISVEHKQQTVLSLIVELVADETIERMPPQRIIDLDLEGSKFRLPLLQVPKRHESQSVRLVSAKLAQIAELEIGEKPHLRQIQNP